MKKALVISIVALLVAAVALVKEFLPCANKTAGISATDVEAVLKDHPEYVVNALQAYDQKLRDEAEAKHKALIKDNEAKLVENNAPFQGPADSKIVMVEFYDYACGYCRRLYPELDKLLAKNTDVKVLFRPVAFVSQYSEYAARAVLAANEQGKFNELHKELFSAQKQLDDKLVDELAEKVGIDVEKMKADMKSDKVNAAFESNHSLAETIQIEGVPTVIINGESVQSAPTAIQSKIDASK
jgi:protein-disulfide isomerase